MVSRARRRAGEAHARRFEFKFIRRRYELVGTKKSKGAEKRAVRLIFGRLDLFFFFFLCTIFISIYFIDSPCFLLGWLIASKIIQTPPPPSYDSKRLSCSSAWALGTPG